MNRCLSVSLWKDSFNWIELRPAKKAELNDGQNRKKRSSQFQKKSCTLCIQTIHSKISWKESVFYKRAYHLHMLDFPISSVYVYLFRFKLIIYIYVYDISKYQPVSSRRSVGRARATQSQCAKGSKQSIQIIKCCLVSFSGYLDVEMRVLLTFCIFMLQMENQIIQQILRIVPKKSVNRFLFIET